MVLDAEIVCLEKRGRPQFKNSLFHRGEPSFVAFDLRFDTGTSLRREQVLDRGGALRRLLGHICRDEPLMYVEHVEHHREAPLFQRVCKFDLEGIVAKLKSGPYVSERERSTWRKILNSAYSQREGREELFEHDRDKEPVPGWHSCVAACAQWE